MKVHPLALHVPPLTADERDRLTESMKGGFDPHRPVVFHEGMILDGRHRWEIAESLGIKAHTTEWKPAFKGDTPADFVLRSTVNRTMTASARAALAAELLPSVAERPDKPKGGGPPGKKVSPVPKDERRSAAVAAKAVGSNSEYVKVAAAVQKKDPAAFQAMKEGKVSMAQAKAIAKGPPPSKSKVKEGIIDPAGRACTDPAAMEAIAHADQFKAIQNAANALRRQAEELCQHPYAAELADKLTQIKADCESIVRVVKFSTPHTTCPRAPQCEVGCKTCKNRRWVSRGIWEATPEGMKQ